MSRSGGAVRSRAALTADVVEAWKCLARARMKAECGTGSGLSGVRIRISFGIIVFCALLGLRFGPVGALLMFGLMPVLLTQELPRALLARALGRSSKVAISALGADTEIAGPPLRGRAAWAVQVIGSLFNLAAALVAMALARSGAVPDLAPLLKALALWQAFWGLAQGLPLLPFRAGRALASRLTVSQRFIHAAMSLAAVVAMAALADKKELPSLIPLLMLAALFAAAATGRAASERLDERSGASDLSEQAHAKLHAGEFERASKLGERALVFARSPSLRQKLWTTLAWAAIGKKDPFLAHNAIGQLPAEAIDCYLTAAYLSCGNRAEEAEQLLREARGLGQRDRETTMLLIDLLFRRGDSYGALELARADQGLLSRDDWRAIEAVMPEARRIWHPSGASHASVDRP